MPSIDWAQEYDITRFLMTETPYSSGENTLCIQLSTPLAPSLQQALDSQWQWCKAQAGSDSIIMPHTLVMLNQGKTIHITSPGINARLIRLDHLRDAFHRVGSPLGRPLAAWLTIAIAQQLQTSAHQHQRVDGYLHLQDIWVDPKGGILSFAPAAPLIRQLVSAPRQDLHLFVAPEARGSGQISTATDVYSLAAIYYELLRLPSEAYPSDLSTPSAPHSNISFPLSVPHLPRPYEELIDFLSQCFSTNRNQRPPHVKVFVESLLNELHASGYDLPEPSLPARIIHEYGPSATLKGPLTMGRDAPNKLGYASVVEHSSIHEETAMATIVDRLPAHADISAPTTAWEDILGDELHVDAFQSEETTPHFEPTVAPRLKLPLPDTGVVNSPLPPLQTEEPTPAAIHAPSVLSSSRPSPAPPPTLEDAVRMPSQVIWAVIGLPAVIIGCILLIASQRSAVPPPIGAVERSLIPESASSPTPAPKPPVVRTSDPKAKPLRLVSVMSNPSGATVFINGDYVGKTPLVLRHTLRNHRRYSVDIEHEGYESWSQPVWAKNGSISLVVHLIPKSRR